MTSVVKYLVYSDLPLFELAESVNYALACKCLR